MGRRKGEDLRVALRDRGANEALRKLAVRLVLDKGMEPAEVADLLDRDADWVRTWAARHAEGGTGALRDLPRPGRPPLVPPFGACTIMWGEYMTHVDPAPLRDAIGGETGVRYSLDSARRFLRMFGFSRKRPALVHASMAGPDETRRWQDTKIPGPLRLRDEGHAVLAQDWTIFVNDTGRGAKHWSPKGKKNHVRHTGSHERFAAFGALADDGRRPFRTHGRFGSSTFVRCPRGPRRKFGRIAAVAGRAPQHREAAVVDYVEACGGDVRLHGLPTGPPHMNASEEPWRRAKHAMRDSEHYRSVDEMRAVAGEHFRVTKYGLNIFAYMRRAPVDRFA